MDIKVSIHEGIGDERLGLKPIPIGKPSPGAARAFLLVASGDRLLRFQSDGTLAWRSDPIAVAGSGRPARYFFGSDSAWRAATSFPRAKGCVSRSRRARMASESPGWSIGVSASAA